MNLKDRTAEFRSICALGQTAFHASPSETCEESAFLQNANKISRAYSATVPSQLEHLRKLAKNQSLFDERPQQEFTAASETIKRQLSLLNRSLQELKQSSAPHPNSTTKTAMEHQRNVLLILQTWIAQSFKSLEQCNEQRNETLKAQRSRRDQFGVQRTQTPPATTSPSKSISNAPTSNPNASPIAARQRPVIDPILSGSSTSTSLYTSNSTLYTTNTNLTTSNTSNMSNNRFTPNVTSLQHDKKYDDHVAIELDQQQSQLQIQQQLEHEPLLGNLRNRSTALTSIESTINELGTIYQQLAHMVSQQGEVVQRIDMNIEDMSVNVQRGQGQLARYLRRVSHGRFLIAKMFAVLIFFLILMKFIFF